MRRTLHMFSIVDLVLSCSPPYSDPRTGQWRMMTGKIRKSASPSYTFYKKELFGLHGANLEPTITPLGTIT
ncbi:hypothetical protein J6590_027561 [Homalodisca vitripennis]|nr:hypothetical protein J6590_027561 [Homalodisca vitripennis]